MRALLLFSACLAVASIAACGSSGDGTGNGTTPGDDAGGNQGDGSPQLPGPGSDGGQGSDTGQGGDGAQGQDSGGDAGVDSGPPFKTADHPPFPQLVRGSANGGVLTAPVVVPIFFPSFDHTTEVKDQLSHMGTVATYWKDAVSEYGVGAYTYGTPVDLTEAAPTSISGGQIVTWLKGKLDGTHPEFGTPTAQSIYVIYYPSTTGVQGSCSDPQTGGVGYGGYHDVLTTGGGVQVAYGVIAECSTFGPTIKNSLDMVTVAGSHEIIEAATDTAPGDGYASIDANGFALDIFLQGNEENGDLCAVNHAFIRPGGTYPYLISRGWSNKAAAAGNLDPCQPALPDQPFVGAAPKMPDMVNVPQVGKGPGAIIPVGQSKTVDVVLWSSGPTTAPFTVAAKQARGDTSLSFTWDKTTGSNGDTLKSDNDRIAQTGINRHAGHGHAEDLTRTAVICGGAKGCVDP